MKNIEVDFRCIEKHFEFCAIKASVDDYQIQIFCSYRSPSSYFNHFVERTVSAMDRIYNSGRYTIFSDDFNVNMQFVSCHIPEIDF